MRTAMLALIIVLTACSGGTGDTPPDVDAPGGTDSSGSNVCTGAAYETCTDNTQCLSQQCRLFMADGIQVCTQNCDASNPCPDFDGTPITCNNMGRCKPPGQHTCTH